MFCIQCEQTLVNDKATGCQFKKGKCGKEAETPSDAAPVRPTQGYWKVAASASR